VQIVGYINTNNSFVFKWSAFHISIILASCTGGHVRFRHWRNDTEKGNLKHWETNMTRCTTNFTWSGLGLNIGLWGEIFVLKSWFIDGQNCDGEKGMNFLYYFQFSAAYDTSPEQLNRVARILKPDRLV